MERRRFLKMGMGTAGTLAVAGTLTKAMAATCGPLTPPQTSGPFYPGETSFHTDNDLTNLKIRPLGQVIYVKGLVQDINCNPIAGANVEIWQACASGRYNNSN